MHELSNKYALAALKEKRSTLAGEIAQLKSQILWREKQLVHLDATLRLFDPDMDPSKLPNKATHINLFKQGELSRYVLDALRRAGEPMAVKDLVTAVLQAMGHGEEGRNVIRVRVRANLSYHAKRETIVKVGEGPRTRWTLAESKSESSGELCTKGFSESQGRLLTRT